MTSSKPSLELSNADGVCVPVQAHTHTHTHTGGERRKKTALFFRRKNERNKTTKRDRFPHPPPRCFFCFCSIRRQHPGIWHQCDELGCSAVVVVVVVMVVVYRREAEARAD